MPRILYTGSLWHGSTSELRKRAFANLGNVVDELDYEPFCQRGNRLFRVIGRKFLIGRGVSTYNKLLLQMAEQMNPELLWVDKGIYIWPSTLEKIKKNTSSTVVHYTPDDYLGQGLYYKSVLKAIKHYDAFFTTKTFNGSELLARGAKRVRYSANAFDPLIHRPVQLTPDELRVYGADVSFIGRWEPDRERMFAWLIEHGVKMKIWGGGWHRVGLARSLRDIVQGRGVFAEEYPKAIAGSKINLNALSKWYRDNETQRSIEIPACGGFMLAERTEKHLEYFEEGKEAEFFGDFQELLGKIRFYLSNEHARLAVAAAGRQRCILSDYSYQNRMQEALAYLQSEGLLVSNVQ